MIDFETLPDIYNAADFDAESFAASLEKLTPRRLPDGTIVDGLLNPDPDGIPLQDSPTEQGQFNDLKVTEFLDKGDKILALHYPPPDEFYGGIINFKFPQEVDVTVIRYKHPFDVEFDLLGKDYSNRIVAKDTIKLLDKGFYGVTDIKLTKFRGIKKLVIRQKTDRGNISHIEYSSCKGKGTFLRVFVSHHQHSEF